MVARGVRTPIMFRFLDIVGDRIRRLNGAFASAMSRQHYTGSYRGVFPVKCNHDKDLVKAIIEFGKLLSFCLFLL